MTKKRRLIAAIGGVVLLGVALMSWVLVSPTKPTLRVIGYSQRSTNGAWTAQLCLSNSTSSQITCWPYWRNGRLEGNYKYKETTESGESRVVQRAKPTAPGSFVTYKVLMPGDQFVMDVPMEDGLPSHEVGIGYELKRFRFPYTNNRLLQRIHNVLGRIKGALKIKTEVKREVWCDEPLEAPSGIATNTAAVGHAR